ncbi:hypothetical protein CK203_001859 [Vitis vinifera]|uniref:RING-CH-type domain-containing protein n=1 Tax=Vitis vinifera TaxID=29760 RepID=A0A438KJ02_VITVI|nr:hypothetical protein CK203_001859 [Vitis vinifera]
MSDHEDVSPLIAPSPMAEPSEIDLEAGQGEQIQCRICLETDGRDFIAPCKCKGTSKYVHRECLDHWRAVRYLPEFEYHLLSPAYKLTTCLLVCVHVDMFMCGRRVCICSLHNLQGPLSLRVHVVADRKWRTLKFRFFVTRDIIFIFLAVQLVGNCFICIFGVLNRWFPAVLASTSMGFDSEISFYYICGKNSGI